MLRSQSRVVHAYPASPFLAQIYLPFLMLLRLSVEISNVNSKIYPTPKRCEKYNRNCCNSANQHKLTMQNLTTINDNYT